LTGARADALIPETGEGEVMDLSLAICTRNRAAQLQRTLEIISQLHSDAAWEIIVVDNGSTDMTPAVVQAARGANPRIIYVREEQQGLGAARNTAWRTARGDIISYVDDDCYPSHGFVDDVLNVFRAWEDVGYITGRITLHDPEDALVTCDLREVPADIPPYSFQRAGVVQGANTSVRRKVLAVIGGFDRRLGAGTRFPCEDADMGAAASWAGFKGRFDPAPSVAHHHGRKRADIPALFEGYDRGRGAYYMKYILRDDSRAAYIKGWSREWWHHRNRSTLRRELMSAAAYLRAYGSGEEITRFLPFLSSLAFWARLPEAEQDFGEDRLGLE
jgi:glycosyltransferase involved in cell wall biosynthesis